MLWVISAIVMASALAPWLYQAGKGLAEAARTQNFPAILEWLAAACGRADFSRYFSRSLAISAIILLPFSAWRIRAIRHNTDRIIVEGSRMPWKSAVIQMVLGCAIAGGMLWGIGMVLEVFGAFVPKSNPPSVRQFLSRTLVPAIAVPLLEEWLFRGLLLGLWLRFARPITACLGTSFFFAFIHFLKPPDGTLFENPSSPLAGFELLGKVLFHFTDPQFFITDFATLFAIGMILAWARLRTGALWFSIGLHAGWIIAFKGFILLYRPVFDHPFNPWGVGQTLRSGIFPLLMLGLTAVICRHVLRRLEIRGEIC